MRMKKIFSAVLALTVICGGTAPFAAEMPEISLTANAALDNCEDILEDGIKYKVYNDHVEVVGYTKDIAEEVVITDRIKKLPVTKIAEGAFEELEIKSITIPDTVTIIENCAFLECNNLEKIEGMKNVKSIGLASFSVCENLKELTLPNSLETIGAFAFNECKSLTSITIPDSVTDLGAGAFFECEELVSVKLSDNLTELKSNKDEHTKPTLYYGTFGECVSLKEIILPDNLEKIGEGSFDACCALETINIPKNVKEIGDAAFRAAKIIYNSLSIGGKAEGSSLKEITVDSANSCFCSVDGVLYNKDCSKLIQYPLGRNEKDFVVPESVKFIGNSAFYYSPIYNISFLGNIEEIDDEAFWCCTKLKSIEFPQSLKRIGISAFGNTTSLFNNIIVILENVEEIGWNAFFRTFSKEIKILNPNCKIGDDGGYSDKTICDTLDGYFRGTIYGYKNSTAQKYSLKKHVKFIYIDEEPETITENGLKYNIYSDHAELIESETTLGEMVTIPAEIKGVPVTEIGKKLFLREII